MKIAQRITFLLFIGAMFMHIFCCGIPVILSIASIGAMIGIAGSDALSFEWYEAYEGIILGVSGTLLLATTLIQYISARIDCRTDGTCTHAPCDDKKHRSQRIFYVAIVLFLISVTLFMLEG